MNRIYKVIYSKARQCSIVVSELAKSSRKGAGHAGTPALARIIIATLAAGILTWGIAPGVSWAADKDIVDKGAQPIAYDISPANDGTNIAVGKNAKVFIGGGTQESMLSFGEKVHKGSFSMNIHDNNHAKQNLPEGMAVGTNSYARTGSIEIGAHTLAGNKIAIGDTTADKLQQFGVASTTLGTNSYTGGGFATTIGSYNVQSNPYAANGFIDTLNNATKNAFATVIGTFNSNESMTGSSSSGIANTIAGTANKVTNSNGAIVLGAGNSVKSSSAYFDASAYSEHFNSVTEMQKALMDGVASSAGGATLVIGGANEAENTTHSQIMGVGNKVKSTTSKKIEYNYLDGFESSITDASHVKVLGQKVTIKKGADSNTVIGDYRTVADNQTNNVIIGNADEKNPITTEKKETVILGYKANATVNGGVAIGSGSIAVTPAEVYGWDPKTNNKSSIDSKVWKSSWAAVSIGDGTHTRQITNLAAGFNDTDAVNVAQLKAAMENAAPKIDFVAGDGIQIEKDSTGTKYTIKANITGGKTDTDTTKVITKEEGSSSGTGSSGASGSGKALEITTETNPISFAADEGTAAGVKPSETLGILGDKTNISTKVDGSKITVSLKKDISVDSVKAGNTTVNNEGVTIAGGPSMTVNGINAGGKKITNVADGTDASDAVNYGQLQNVENQVTSNTQNINYLNGRVGELGDRINKVGAGAAALAALHPLDYDPEDKWDFAAGVGNYRNATAAAVGLFYRPNERTMFNLGWTMGDNRNMVNGGFSVKFGKSNKYIKYSKAEMASVIDNQSREIAELKAKDAQNAKDNAEMKAEIEALKKQVEALAAKK
ncbi:ESPR-type extended signal peptide-containing protein [uncultured Dialister sp.]|uniref:ESPR-type extended signal peptide-containing protein n=1 Tax=uncultured Dialister sp. TaxID=278064 RepID=UPI00266F2A60|nr:ESPR-type extended signal peptide-containing protein [uncultured Dialister sp.]